MFSNEVGGFIDSREQDGVSPLGWRGGERDKQTSKQMKVSPGFLSATRETKQGKEMEEWEGAAFTGWSQVLRGRGDGTQVGLEKTQKGQ